MTREVILTFFGERRWTELDPNAAAQDDHDEHATEDANGAPLPVGPGAPHHVVHGAPVAPAEAPRVMTIPMVVLAVGALVLGILNLPFGDRFKVLDHWLEPSVRLAESTWEIPGSLEWTLEIAVVVLSLIGIAGGYALYQRITDREAQRRFEPELLEKSWYYDLGISAFMGGPVRRASEWLAFWFERTVIDGAVNGTGWIVDVAASRTRRLQTGYVRNYALGLTIGAACLIAFVLYRASF